MPDITGYVLWDECPGCCEEGSITCPCESSECWQCECNESITHGVQSSCNSLCSADCAGECIPCPDMCIAYICDTDSGITNIDETLCNEACALAEPPGTCFPYEYEC